MVTRSQGGGLGLDSLAFFLPWAHFVSSRVRWTGVAGLGDSILGLLLETGYLVKVDSSPLSCLGVLLLPSNLV